MAFEYKELPERYLVIDTYESRFYAPEDEMTRFQKKCWDFRNWDGNGVKPDAWFTFEHLDGSIRYVLVANVEHFYVSTPEQRQKLMQLKAESQLEHRQWKDPRLDDEDYLNHETSI